MAQLPTLSFNIALLILAYIISILHFTVVLQWSDFVERLNKMIILQTSTDLERSSRHENCSDLAFHKCRTAEDKLYSAILKFSSVA